jgi:hypothetical protein
MGRKQTTQPILDSAASKKKKKQLEPLSAWLVDWRRFPAACNVYPSLGKKRPLVSAGPDRKQENTLILIICDSMLTC